jgi:hypothetical protein
MKTYFILLLCGTILEAGFLSAFIFVSESERAGFSKSAVVLTFLMLMFFLLWIATIKLSNRWIMALCISLSVGGVVVLQTFGYLLYPGLVKDVQFLSGDYFILTFRSFSAFLMGLLLPSVVLLGIRTFQLKQWRK